MMNLTSRRHLARKLLYKKTQEAKYPAESSVEKAVNKIFNPSTKLGTPFNAKLLNELYLQVLIFIGSLHSTSTALETCHTEHTYL